MTTLANINGANITRLRFQQMHTNVCKCVLMQPPVDDATTQQYIACVENLVVSTDIPIFPKDTVVFRVVDVVSGVDMLGLPTGTYIFSDDEKDPDVILIRLAIVARVV